MMVKKQNTYHEWDWKQHATGAPQEKYSKFDVVESQEYIKPARILLIVKYETFCTIWYHLYKVKNVKNIFLGKLFFRLHFSSAFFTFFKLYKWYQIAQRTKYIPRKMFTGKSRGPKNLMGKYMFKVFKQIHGRCFSVFNVGFE